MKKNNQQREEDAIKPGAPDDGPPVQQPIQTTRSYFTKEINEKIAGMTEEEMLHEMESLEQTSAWVAILKYTQIRLQHSQSAVISGDPFKEPTNLARNQGVMLGLCDLQNAIILLKRDREEKNRANQEASEDE